MSCFTELGMSLSNMDKSGKKRDENLFMINHHSSYFYNIDNKLA